jgi:hypothetical protein
LVFRERNIVVLVKVVSRVTMQKKRSKASECCRSTWSRSISHNGLNSLREKALVGKGLSLTNKSLFVSRLEVVGLKVGQNRVDFRDRPGGRVVGEDIFKSTSQSAAVGTAISATVNL